LDGNFAACFAALAAAFDALYVAFAASSAAFASLRSKPSIEMLNLTAYA
jgi:hypothetical protein